MNRNTIKYKVAVVLIVNYLFLFSSCSVNNKIRSLSVIGKGYHEVKEYMSLSNNVIKKVSNNIDLDNDTLIVVSTMNNFPLEAVFLFENDECYYEEINIYCSKCADHAVNTIVNDKNYDFEAVDAVNYISKKDKSIVLRLKEKLTADGNCNEITIVKVKS